MDQNYKQFHKVNIFVSNADKKYLETQDVWTLYRIRWQIELLFKAWKSDAKIQDAKAMSIHRLQAMLYAKLIWLLMAYRIYIEIQTDIWHQNKEKQMQESQISLLKTIKVIYLQ